MESDRLRILGASAAHAMGEWRGHTLAIWANIPAVEEAQALANTVERLANLRPGRSVYLAQIRRLSSLPDEPVRRVFIELGRKVNDTLNCIGVIIDGEGFGAAALRALVTGLGMAASIRFPLRSFSTLPDMAAWVRPRLVSAHSEFGTDLELQDAFDTLAADLKSK